MSADGRRREPGAGGRDRRDAGQRRRATPGGVRIQPARSTRRGTSLSHEWDFGDGSPGSTAGGPRSISTRRRHLSGDADRHRRARGRATATAWSSAFRPLPWRGARRLRPPRRPRTSRQASKACGSRAAASGCRAMPLRSGSRARRPRPGRAPACSTLPRGSTPAAAAPRARSGWAPRASIRSGKSARVGVKVSPRGRRLLARHGKLTTSARAIAPTPCCASGQRARRWC